MAAPVKLLLRVLIAAILLVVAVACTLILWLRWEFARLEHDPSAYQSLMSSPVDRPFAREQSPCREHYPQKRAWFGALHVHTAASYDATAFGSLSTADDAYRFGRGSALELKLQGDAPEHEAPRVQLSRPLDFMAVTDHAEALGENRVCYLRSDPAYGRLVCRLYRGDLRLPVDATLQPMVRLAATAIFGQDRPARLCGADARRCLDEARLAWRDNQRATQQWHDHSEACQFTTFHAYEYSLAEEASNLHRNVIFSSDAVPQEVASAKEARRPLDLWRWLDGSCRQSPQGCDALAIPHNSNWSSGRMWQPYRYAELEGDSRREHARLRAAFEPLAEIMQTKGDSECRNGLPSVLGGADELCNFEKLRPSMTPEQDCGNDSGSGGMQLQGCVSRFNYLRHVLPEGQADAASLGFNPFRLGFIAATDTHNAAPAAEQEARYQGSHGSDRERVHRLRSEVEVPGGIATGSPVRYNPGGLAGIYAPENSRAALFAAMQGRETFGTSGPRIKPRFFAGWSLPDSLCEDPQLIARAYRLGVPMGGQLRGPAPSPSGPRFAVTAIADPEGEPLQRIQIIKTWVDADGGNHQQIYDVAGTANNGAGVDTASCRTYGPGEQQLCASWMDPEFDASQAAVYYARVLQNPSCRWSQFDCLALPDNEQAASCQDPGVPKVIQERAWTSPIWFEPG